MAARKPSPGRENKRYVELMKYTLPLLLAANTLASAQEQGVPGLNYFLPLA